jgi:hypothetical protein
VEGKLLMVEAGKLPKVEGKLLMVEVGKLLMVEVGKLLMVEAGKLLKEVGKLLMVEGKVVMGDAAGKLVTVEPGKVVMPVPMVVPMDVPRVPRVPKEELLQAGREEEGITVPGAGMLVTGEVQPVVVAAPNTGGPRGVAEEERKEPEGA